uniref:THAP4-like heme-binding beta-barrel domain-containing protein n=1 Tax=Romanomermis culicivorax TaxID=13658 RepID=A0A915KHL7_ROMCU
MIRCVLQYEVQVGYARPNLFYLHSLVHTNTPLPPLLEPLEFLLGAWRVSYNSHQHYPTDFAVYGTGYYEELHFNVVPPTMFGSPYINITYWARNNGNKTDIQSYVGFMTVRPTAQGIKVGSMIVGNTGITVIEEGFIGEQTMNVTAQYLVAHPKNQGKLPRT